MSTLIYISNILLIVGLIMWLWKQRWGTVLQPYWVPALLLKLFCGILMGLLYHFYYKAGDTLTYFNASLKLTTYAQENPSLYLKLILFNEFESEQFRNTIPFSKFAGFSNSFFMLKLTSLLNVITGNSYYLNALYFSLFSFWGMAKLAAVLTIVYPGTKKAAIVGLLFFPSVVFWSSGLLKDALLMGSMCWIIAFILQLAHKQPIKWTELVLFPFMLYLFIRIKLFFSAALLLFLIAYLIVNALTRYFPSLKRTGIQLGLYGILLVLVGGVGTQLINIYKVNFIVEQLVRTYESMRVLSLHVPHIEYPDLKPTFQSVLAHSPEALLNALFRPYIGEASGFLYIFSGLENLFLIILFLMAVISGFVKRNSKESCAEFHLFYLAISLFILIAAIVNGISTPNFGTLTRYKIIFLPFLVYLLLQSHYAQRLLYKLDNR
jgi:hypothetical protein